VKNETILAILHASSTSAELNIKQPWLMLKLLTKRRRLRWCILTWTMN